MKRAAVIGHPIAHSRSPELFARFARATGIALEYRAVDVTPEALAAALDAWRNDAEFVGCNVTLPHKERALALADRVEPTASQCGAANVLTRDGGALVAANTDVEGIEGALRAHGITLNGKHVAILGTGGAARAAAAAAHRSGASSIAIAGRNPERAARLAADFGGRACGLDAVPRANVYVQTTPLGMTGQEQISLLPADAPAGAVAFDVVYTPANTPFLTEARARGMLAIGGETMFVEQAAATFARWFGVRPATAGAVA